MTQEDIILKFRINELEECIDLIEDEISNKINQGNYKTEESYMNLVLNCTGKSLLTLRELILLCKNGFRMGRLAWLVICLNSLLSFAYSSHNVKVLLETEWSRNIMQIMMCKDIKI